MASPLGRKLQKLFRFPRSFQPSSGTVNCSLGAVSVTLTSEWDLAAQSPDRIEWRTKEDDALTLSHAVVPADFPVLTDLAAVRAYGRQLAALANGGLLSADVHQAGGMDALQVVFKIERLPAYAYTALVMVPAGNVLYTMELATMERDVTGVRDAMASAVLLQRGELKIPDNQPSTPGGGVPVEGWLVDPYDPQYPGRVMRKPSGRRGV
jgi:hypothetical protein